MSHDLVDRLERGLRAQARTVRLPSADLEAIQKRHRQRGRRRMTARGAAVTAALLVVAGYVGLGNEDRDAQTTSGPPSIEVEVTPLTDDIETGIYELMSGGDVLVGLLQDVGIAVSPDGRTWSPSTPPRSTNVENPQVVLSEPGLLILADHEMRDGGTHAVVHVSTDAGRTWNTERLADSQDVAIFGATVHDGTVRLAGNVMAGRYSVDEAMQEITAALGDVAIPHDDVTFRLPDGHIDTDDANQPDADLVTYELRSDGQIVGTGQLSDVGVSDELVHRAFGGGDALDHRGTVTYSRPVDGTSWERHRTDAAAAAGVDEETIHMMPNQNLLVGRGGTEHTDVYLSLDLETWRRLAVPDGLIVQTVFVGPHGVYASATPARPGGTVRSQLLLAPDIDAVDDPSAWRAVHGLPTGAVWVADTEEGVVAANDAELAASADGIHFHTVDAPALDASPRERLKVVALDDGRIFGLAFDPSGANARNRLVSIDLADR